MTEKKKQEIPILFEFDDFFKPQTEIEDNSKEKLANIDVSLIDNFKDHPFKIIENAEFLSLKNSIEIEGIITPTVIRRKDNGRYEMLSGHRRKRACELLGIDKIPCIIKDLSDDEATIYMVDCNIQREKLLPSEKAFAYKMKHEALKHQGKRNDLTSGPVDQKLAAEKIGDETNESEKTVRRYIRITYLIPELIKFVDNTELKVSPSIALRPATEISYLNEKEQKLLLDFINKNLSTPSHEQAIKLKELSKHNKLDNESLYKIMDKPKPNQRQRFNIEEEKLRNVLPKNIQREKIEDFIIKACSYYTKILKQKEKER